MSLHTQIMNLPHRLGEAIEHPAAEEIAAYKKGHRDARHDAAELANEVEARLDALAAEIARLREAIVPVLRDALDRVDVHPCDEHDDDVRARRMSEPLQALYRVTQEPKTTPQGSIERPQSAKGMTP